MSSKVWKVRLLSIAHLYIFSVSSYKESTTLSILVFSFVFVLKKKIDLVNLISIR